MELTKTTCCKARKPVGKTGKYRLGGGMSFFSTLLIILIPKCPFCVAAYSGALLLFFDIESGAIMPYVVHFKPILGVLILLLVAFNYKGKKTLLSILVASVSLTLLLLSTYAYISIVSEWILYGAFFFAAWYNGNFQYFYRFIRFGKRNKSVSNKLKLRK